ncbi:DNA cytosine methyltransferase [Micromonospora sp. NBC_01655]|uniref:DNA cytosine methyltransferase n=1 Tax=Micromonospora sp. NBC_01655 TaxID=2975983 RepID=UPI00225A8FA9|nr:DNA cytosine methyltransferase [Micromonospora sp. NBC_01655]MCX4470476.1 DNA cytosine methyltransferase [Micromonospora sp. NBC_01655]
MILDLYAGAGGWDEGARHLGLTTVGLEIWHDACVTAVRAGHPRIRCDIATYPTAPFTGRVTGLIASPPCQAWSMAGKRTGEQDKARVHELVNAYAAGSDDPGDGWADPRSHHAAQPVRWIRDLRPDWVCLEQVPPVLDLWRHIGDVLRGWGYSVWVGVLNAADYGVPQTRRRAILIASRVRPVHQPETTHEQDPPTDALFGARRPWVSMAQALGWHGVDRPARTVCGDRSPRWAYGQGNSYDTGWTLVNGPQDNATERSADEPAGTIYCSRPGNLRWAVDRRTRSKGPGGSIYPTPLVSDDRPAPTLTSKVGEQWVLRSGQSVAGEGRAERQPTEAAVTITGRADLCQWTNGDDTRRVAVPEAAILQSFPPDYPLVRQQNLPVPPGRQRRPARPRRLRHRPGRRPARRPPHPRRLRSTVTPHHLHALAAAHSLAAARDQLRAVARAELARTPWIDPLPAAPVLRSPGHGTRHSVGSHGDPVSATLVADPPPVRVTTWATRWATAERRLSGLAALLRITDRDPLPRILAAIPRMLPGTAAVIGRHLADEDALVRGWLDLPPARRPLVGVACPHCGARLLHVQEAGPVDAWTVVCDFDGDDERGPCRCVGEGCQCRMEGAVEGVAHIWPRDAVIGAVAGAAHAQT